MKLKEAFEFARACELSTVGESMYNILIHASNLFDYESANAEWNELNEDLKELTRKTGLDENSSIEEATKYCS